MHPQSVQEVDEVQTANLRSLLDLQRSLVQSALQAEQTRLSLLQLHEDIKGSLLGVHQELQHRLIQQAEAMMRRMQSSIMHLVHNALSVPRTNTDNVTVLLYCVLFNVYIRWYVHTRPL